VTIEEEVPVTNAAAGGDATAAATATVESKPLAPPRERPIAPTHLAIIVALLAFVMFVLPNLVDLRWLLVATSVVIYTVIMLGLGLLIGRVGLVSLCQFVLFAVGAWVSLRLHYLTSLPLPLVVLSAGVVTAGIGVLIGLPALRLSGLYLALITLMAAGGLTVVLARLQFPNGGDGFSGNSRAGGSTSRLPRPSLALGDVAYFRYCIIVAIVMFLIAAWHVRGRAGRAWAAIRQSEVTALAAGVNTTLYKLWAFALASFMAGIGGGLLAAAKGGVSINQFPVQNSVILLAVVMMGGVLNVWGAVVGGILYKLLPELLDNWGVSTEWSTILFGVGVLQVLLTAPGGLSDQVPKDLAKLGRKLRGLVVRQPALAEGGS
jgi:branched-chain amino acid transport system permease protein